MKIAIPKERRPYETRVAASPETVRKLTQLGAEVTVESGAGTASAMPDQAYADAGATLARSSAELYGGAAVILKVQRPLAEELNQVARGTALAAILDPYRQGRDMQLLAEAGITAFAMDLMPRITRAQSMDVLSSQANLAGYKAVLDAAGHFGGAFPMMTTAAGTVKPAQVLVMGAGVAGLQAIATARRLGGVVHATDVRPAAKEQVASLGGKFVAVEDEEFRQAETAAGYAKEMSKEYQAKQAALIAETIRKMDVVITTAAIPGRPAPRLVSDAMLATMKPGAVVVDLAVDSGGNVEGIVAGEVVERHGVQLVGYRNVASRLPAVASQLYARNLLTFLQLSLDKESRSLKVNWDDEIIKGTLVTRDGAVVHPALRKAEPTATQVAAPPPVSPEGGRA
jgi:NAD(P) transhydrogenase subunit alpha